MSSFAGRLLPAILVLLFAPAAHAADVSLRDSNVRTNEPQLALLLRQAVAGSPSFRVLVERLNESDVVVYLRSVRGLPSYIDGTMSFVGAAGGRRYILVSLAWGRTDLRTIATLGHELQHALEVAERPAIVDMATLGDAYAAFGQQSPGTGRGRSYDTAAATLAGERVRREMLALQDVAR